MDSMIKKFRISSGEEVDLKNHHTDFTAGYKKEDGIVLLDEYKKEIESLQKRLYASDRYSLLIIFQAMDAAGKDSAIAHVMSGLNPQGCQVYSFKQPSAEEYDHDFLWRHYKALPEKGRIGIHNRSHYESVLVCRVHPELIMKERPVNYEHVEQLDKRFWDQRYESICEFEKHLLRNGTLIIKFFLHVSENEQKKRFLERIEDPAKNWKFSSFDLEERKRWNDYMKAYQEAIFKTSADHAPWYIIPADKKWFSRIAIGKIIVDSLKTLDLHYPQLTEEEKSKLGEAKKILLK